MVSLRVEREAEDVVMVVQDTGVGIAEKNLPFVFDRFWQADDSSKRKFQGVGIGLSLVKEFTELQGGTASVQSVEGKGATFTLRLPLVKAETPASAGADGAAGASAPDSEAKAGAAPAQSEEWLANLYHRAALLPTVTPVEAESPASRPRRGRRKRFGTAASPGCWWQMTSPICCGF